MIRVSDFAFSSRTSDIDLIHAHHWIHAIVSHAEKRSESSENDKIMLMMIASMIA